LAFLPSTAGDLVRLYALTIPLPRGAAGLFDTLAGAFVDAFPGGFDDGGGGGPFFGGALDLGSIVGLAPLLSAFGGVEGALCGIGGTDFCGIGGTDF